MKWWVHSICCITCCLWALSSIAQVSEYKDAISWSKPFDVDRSFKLRQVVTLSDGSAAIIGANEDGLFHFKFGTDGAYLGAEKLLKSASSLYGFIVQGDSLFVVDAERMQENRKLSIRLFNLTSSSSSTPLITFSNVFPFGRKAPKKVVWGVSPNGKYWMLSQQKGYEKGAGSTLAFKTLNIDSSDTASFELTLPFESDDFEYLNGLVSDSGSVFVTGKTGIQLNSPFRRKFLLFSYAPKLKELREFDVNPNGLFLQDVQMHASGSGITALGLYSDDPFADDQTSGYLITELSSKGVEVTNKHIQKYSPDEVKRNEIIGSIGSEGSIEDFFLQEMVLANSWYGVFEKRFLDQVCTTDPRTGIMDCTDQFNYLGLTIVNLNNPGASGFVNRQQVDFNRPGLFISNANIPMGSEMIILYNDHFKNDQQNSERIMNNPSRSTLRAMVIDESLKSRFYSLSEERQNNFVFVSKVAYSSSEKGCYLLSSDGKQFRLGFLLYEPLRN